MVSSTFTDLKEHRKALIDAIERENFKAVGMEYADFPKPVDLIKASLEMVANAAAYVAVIGHKYGQTPVDPARNPERLSITELEFNEADRLEKPILLFVMGENHPVTKADIETDADKIAKLNAFRERAKEMGDSKVHRIYAAFDNLEDFTRKAIHAIAALRRTAEAEAPAECDPVPTPPELYAEPPYIGSHQFVGRRSELETLDDWASATNPHPVLLFEAIGGSGKSMLTWEWATNHATEVGQDWAGRFWYSFYERGAIMADFCRRALAYMTRDPPERFAKMKTPELSKRLLHRLRSAPWLIVLDGLERVLVAYHRIDAAELADEAANAPTDQMAHRDPCAAIRPEDDDVLRSLAAATPSKVLITSRLIPRVLLNPASQAIPGVLRVTLPGLRPADAEALFRSSGISGDSKAIQDYLRTYCDCHPLVTGALAGLVNDFLPKTGNFDAWAKDPAGGDRLNLADLDLAQKRNHILQAAIDALPNASRELVSTMALLSEEADYETLHALGVSDGIRDLERRGLLQFDRQAKRYDLHPVVRSIAAGGLSAEQRESYGQRVCDFFSRQTTRALDQAETLEDVRYALQVLRTLLKMRRYEQASSLLYFGLSDALLFNLEANAEVLSILRPFFPNGWSVPPGEVKWIGPQYLGHMAMIALQASGEDQEAVNAGGWTIRVTLAEQEWHNTVTALGTVSYALVARNRMAAAARCQETALDLATLIDDKELMFIMLACRFGHLALRGQMNEAEETWRVLDPMGRDWSRTRYRPGDARSPTPNFASGAAI